MYIPFRCKIFIRLVLVGYISIQKDPYSLPDVLTYFPALPLQLAFDDWLYSFGGPVKLMGGS